MRRICENETYDSSEVYPEASLELNVSAFWFQVFLQFIFGLFSF